MNGQSNLQNIHSIQTFVFPRSLSVLLWKMEELVLKELEGQKVNDLAGYDDGSADSGG